MLRPDHQHAIATIDAALTQFLSTGPRQVYRAYGNATPTNGATISSSPRLVLTTEGVNEHEIPQGARSVQQPVPCFDAVYVTPHAWNRPTWRGRYQFLTIDWQPNHVRYYLRRHQHPGESALPPTMVIRGGPAPHATQALLRALDAVAATPIALATISRAVVLQAQYDLRDAIQPANATWLQAIDYIERNFARACTRKDVATACGVHTHSLSRIFQHETTHTFISLVTQRRLLQAEWLLPHGELSISDIAQRCGFQSSEYFTNVFRKQYGLSPTAWRLQRQTRDQR